jgi:hypothetical protein
LVVWVHGNRVERNEARHEGLTVYRALLPCVPDQTPIRFLIWSWPTERVRGHLRDVRQKAYRSDPAGAQLACVLARVDAHTPIGLVGFSFGARVITGALNELAHTSIESEPTHAARRAVFFAAAVDDDWLLPGHVHGEALSQLDSLLLLNNSCDRALRRYHWLDRCRRPSALGYVGLPCAAELGEDAAKVEQEDVRSIIGCRHDSFRYYCQPDDPQSQAEFWLRRRCGSRQRRAVPSLSPYTHGNWYKTGYYTSVAFHPAMND